MDFKLESQFKPTGDQPQAIDALVEGLNNGLRTQVLRGVTGSGKTFTMANIIEKVNRPTLVICHNKTLAAQLCNELREFFPRNRVEFFVSYYDYYMPESYIPSRDLYIEKEVDINDEIDKLRHSATFSLAQRRDTIVVASVSCIYGLGAPQEYISMALSLRPNDEIDRESVIKRLVELQYQRNDLDFARGVFRVRGDTIDVFPSYSGDISIRIEFFGDIVECISEVHAITGNKISTLSHVAIFPASHYVIGVGKKQALEQMGKDLVAEVKRLTDEGKILEAQRLKQRCTYDMEMISELNTCSGIENYSRYFDGRKAGQAPFTLLDYFPSDFITFIDESHITLPQIRGMYNGDRARKDNLVNFGFRMSSAYDNRPLRYEEFDDRINQFICMSATPAPYELGICGQVVEQIIRPTGLIDPQVTVLGTEGQIDNLISQIDSVVRCKGRVLVTTLTKRMAESLTEYLAKRGIRVRYMHSEIDTLERIEIITGLKKGAFDVLVGINLLREGLDLPQVQLVAILDADKEGFLRSESALVQTIGRAARNVDGHVVMYADNITGSMRRAIDETNRRRIIQQQYNATHGITPKTIEHNVANTLEITKHENPSNSVEGIRAEIENVQSSMKLAASQLDFERAIILREQLNKLQRKLDKENQSKHSGKRWQK
ncbi:MAG: excinuclease ABC subunit UvrB [Clostridia bacterium]|nr:excinuclease ABC subunit UvrB [Clostridia bacterium]